MEARELNALRELKSWWDAEGLRRQEEKAAGERGAERARSCEAEEAEETRAEARDRRSAIFAGPPTPRV